MLSWSTSKMSWVETSAPVTLTVSKAGYSISTALQHVNYTSDMRCSRSSSGPSQVQALLTRYILEQVRDTYPGRERLSCPFIGPETDPRSLVSALSLMGADVKRSSDEPIVVNHRL